MDRYFWVALFLGVGGCADVNGQLVPSFMAPRTAAGTAPASTLAVFDRSRDICRQSGLDACRGVCSGKIVYLAGPVPPYYCKALAVEESDQMSALIQKGVNADFVHGHVTAMDGLCKEGFPIGCAMRDKLQPMVATAEAADAARQAAIVRATTIRAKIDKVGNAELQHSGLAMQALGRGDLDAAEREADASQGVVDRVAADLKAKRDAEVARRAKVAEEWPRVEAAEQACSDLAVCKKACAGGDQFFCVRMRLVEASRAPSLASPDKAIEVAHTACEASIAYGCSREEAVKRDRKQYIEDLAVVWGDVDRALDDVARLRFTNRLVRQLLPEMNERSQARSLRALARAETAAGVKLRDDFCPAKGLFIARYGAAEFASEARDQCTNRAPELTGKGGVPVTITADCAAVAATPCPPSRERPRQWTLSSVTLVAPPEMRPPTPAQPVAPTAPAGPSATPALTGSVNFAPDDMQFASALVKKTLPDLLAAIAQRPKVEQRLRTLMGADYGQLEGRVVFAIEQMSQVIVAEGCRPHACGDDRVIVAIDLARGTMHCGLALLGEVRILSEDPANVPPPMLSWKRDPGGWNTH